VSGVFEHLDEVLERVWWSRDELLSDPFVANRSERLAAVFESEARLWSQFYELSSLRLVWRAALAAEAGARVNAALWARRAEMEVPAEMASQLDAVAGRAAAVRPHLIRMGRV
jgi:hypothetical protein